MSEPNNDELALEQARLERLRAEQSVLDKQSEIAAIQRREREARQEQAFKDAATAPGVPKFYNNKMVIDLVRKQYEVSFDDEGTGTGVIDGQKVPLTEVFRAFARNEENAPLIDGRSLKALREAEEREREKNQKYRSEMTIEDKVKFINAHGDAAFANLPINRPLTTGVPKTFAEYISLPRTERMSLVAKYGENWLTKLQRKK